MRLGYASPRMPPPLRQHRHRSGTAAAAPGPASPTPQVRGVAARVYALASKIKHLHSLPLSVIRSLRNPLEFDAKILYAYLRGQARLVPRAPERRRLRAGEPRRLARRRPQGARRACAPADARGDSTRVRRRAGECATEGPKQDPAIELCPTRGGGLPADRRRAGR